MADPIRDAEWTLRCWEDEMRAAAQRVSDANRDFNRAYEGLLATKRQLRKLRGEDH